MSNTHLTRITDIYRPRFRLFRRDTEIVCDIISLACHYTTCWVVSRKVNENALLCVKWEECRAQICRTLKQKRHNLLLLQLVMSLLVAEAGFYTSPLGRIKLPHYLITCRCLNYLFSLKVSLLCPNCKTISSLAFSVSLAFIKSSTRLFFSSRTNFKAFNSAFRAAMSVLT